MWVSLITAMTVAGNHDYYATQSPQYLLADSQGPADEARETLLGTKPYYSVMLNGINFVMLNSMEGPMWDISMGLSGSFGLPQLEWLEGELSKGAPTLLFMHHPPTLNEEEEGQVTIEEIIQAHSDTIIAVFAGHLHVWSRGEVGGESPFTSPRPTRMAFSTTTFEWTPKPIRWRF